MCSCQRTKMARVLLEGVEIGNKRGGGRRERGPGGVEKEGRRGGVYDCTRVAYDDMRHEECEDKDEDILFGRVKWVLLWREPAEQPFCREKGPHDDERKIRCE